MTPHSKQLSIADAAMLAGISKATVHNWLKAGLIRKAKNGFVLRSSLETYLKNTSRLNLRANKSRKDMHNQEQYRTEVLKNLPQSDNPGAEYESGLSDSYKNAEGIYYTPAHIVEDMLPAKFPEGKNHLFCDPCCGSGNFLLAALDKGIPPENLYGFDVDPVAVEITRKRIHQKTGNWSPNIQQADFLEVAQQTELSFDSIFTNPPWGKKLSKAFRNRLSQKFHTGSSQDTCSLFFFASLSLLNPKGTLGFLLPESFFNISAFENARKTALQYKISKLVDYGKAFKGLLTKAQAITLTKEKPSLPHDSITCIDTSKGQKFQRTMDSFLKMPRYILSPHCSQDEALLIQKLLSRPHLCLKHKVDWAMGIVTGDNTRFLFSRASANRIPVIKGSDISPAGIKKSSRYLSRDLSLYQQAAPLEHYLHSEKIVYRFINSRLVFAIDTEQRLVLNSANIIILDKEFPLSPQQLCQLFNSDFMNWMFQKIFRTRKILRGDLEQLPIFSDYFQREKEFNEKDYIRFLGLKNLEGSYTEA
jgi:site-specific DNA-methyltransferase (adenine-specific)